MMAARFADLHQHVLWGMDDGPADAKAMYTMLEAAEKSGIRLIAATPHAYPQRKAFDWIRYRERLMEANAYCRSRQWDMRLIGGCEILYCDWVPDLLRAGRLPTLGGTRHVLLEFCPDTPLHEIGRAADNCYKAGCFPIIAHVERCCALRKAMLRPMRFKEDHGLIYQMNCDTLLTPRTLTERLFVRRMMEERAIDLLATDAHDTQQRPARMRQAYAKAEAEYGQAYAHALVSFGFRLLEDGGA